MAHAVPMAHAKQLASESTNNEPVPNVDGGTQFVGLVMFLSSATVMFAALFFSFERRTQPPSLVLSCTTAGAWAASKGVTWARCFGGAPAPLL